MATATAAARNIFKPATRQKLKLRMALDGPSGAGKTFTALRAATALAGPSGRIAVINTESGAICKYLGLSPDGTAWEFDIVEPDSYSPSTYTELILAAGAARYDVLIIDSLSHAWEGEGGALDQVDRKAGDGNKFTAWKDVTPQHRRMIEAILRSPCHVIATMRTKTDFVLEPNDKGKMVPKRVGMKTVQREGMEYEFDIVCDLDIEHVLKVSKTRCPEMDGLIVCKPSATTFAPLIDWLADGSEVSADYYARSDADLRTEQRVANASKTPEQRRKEAAEKQRAAAKANGKSDIGNQAESHQQADPRVQPATDEQLDRIEALAEQVCESADDLMAVISKHAPGIERLSQLSTLAAQLAIGDLLAAGADKSRTGEEGEAEAVNAEADVPFETTADLHASTTTEPANHEPPPDLKTEHSTISQAQRAELKRLADKLEWPVEGEDSQTEWLRKHGLANFRGLSELAAFELIIQLRDMAGETADEIPF